MAKASKKEAILTAATFFFADRGFKETSISEVAKTTNIAGATIFYHYKTKEDLFIAVLAGVKEGIISASDDYFEEKTFDTGMEMLLGTVSFYLYLAGIKEEWFRLLHRHHPYKLAEANPVCRNHLKEIYDCLVEMFERAVIRGQEDGSIREMSARKAALIALSMVDGVVQFKNINLYDAGALYNELMESCRRMVERRPGEEAV